MHVQIQFKTLQWLIQCENSGILHGKNKLMISVLHEYMPSIALAHAKPQELILIMSADLLKICSCQPISTGKLSLSLSYLNESLHIYIKKGRIKLS